MEIEKQFENHLKKFKLQTGLELVDAAITKGLGCGYFIENENDLYEIYKQDESEFTSLILGLKHSFKPIQTNGLSNRRVEMALRVSLINTRFDSDRMKINETYISNLVYSQEQLAKGLCSFNPFIAQNPLAFLIDNDNRLDYFSIINGTNIQQLGLSKKNGNGYNRNNKFFLNGTQKILPHTIDEVIKHAYHPTVWYLILSDTLLSYTSLFPKVKEYVDKLKTIPKNG